MPECLSKQPFFNCNLPIIYRLLIFLFKHHSWSCAFATALFTYEWFGWCWCHCLHISLFDQRAKMHTENCAWIILYAVLPARWLHRVASNIRMYAPLNTCGKWQLNDMLFCLRCDECRDWDEVYCATTAMKSITSIDTWSTPFVCLFMFVRFIIG